MNSVRVGICGLGTVGSGTFNVLRRNSSEISARAGCDIVITHLGARSNKHGLETAGLTVSQDIFAVARDPGVDILVELIGGSRLI